MFGLRVRLSTNTHEALVRNANTDEVFKKLVQLRQNGMSDDYQLIERKNTCGMICEAHNEDILFAVIVNEPRNDCADERFACPFSKKGHQCMLKSKMTCVSPGGP
jgi:hypothetical protein